MSPVTTHQPQPGDFFLTIIGGWKGRAVQIGQWLNGDGWSDWQHAGLYLGNGEIIEAEPGRDGARIVPLSNYDDAPIAWSSWPLTAAQRARVCAEGRALEHTRYAWLGYVAIALHRLHIPAPRLRKYIADSRMLICSQLVDEAYHRAGIELFRDGRWPGDVTPADLGHVLEGPA